MKIKLIKGIGPKKEAILKKANIETSDDLLHIFPRKYVDKSYLCLINNAKNNEMNSIIGTIIDIKIKRGFNKKDILIIKIESNGYIGEIIFFNASYFKNNFKFQKDYYFYGKIEKRGMTFKMIHPEFASIEDNDFLSIEPVYSLPEGISQRNMRQYINQILEIPLNEILPCEIVKKQNLCSREYAYKNIHFPDNRGAYKEAKYRLIYEEFFYYIFGNKLLKEYHSGEKGELIKLKDTEINNLIQQLPFKLTSDQIKVFNEIKKDLNSKRKMNRLLQGDVGSGKTVVAVLASYLTYLSNYQVAIMVPTEVLAVQHFESFKKLLPKSVNICLLTSSIKNKNDIYKKLVIGEIDIIIGTQSLIQEPVIFNNLGLIVTDEQHRFGVNQRKKIISKNQKANYLMMSATPIPRTMSMVLYSDIDISTIVELPKGRKEIITKLANKLSKFSENIKDTLNDRQQGYIVFPLIEESKFFKDVTSIENGIDEINKEFSDYSIGIVHGQMKFEERKGIIDKFKNKEFQLLVATTVIEVGIDIQNASFIVIYNADRFGLSQLHQLRGRVGRGLNQSYCYLLSNSENNNQRLNALVESNDGFYIAEKDLKIRGPGEVLGIRQHGSNHFLIADFFEHSSILNKVNSDIIDIFDKEDKFREYINMHRKEITI